MAYKGLERNPNFWKYSDIDARRKGGMTSKRPADGVSKQFAKKYSLVDHTGVEKVVSNMTKFCKEEGYNRNTFVRWRNTGRPNHYGWLVYNHDYIDPTTNVRTCE